VFFIIVSVITVRGSITTSIFFNSILFDGKINQVGTVGRSKFKIPNNFPNTNFRSKSILIFGVTLKQMTLYSWNFHWFFIFAFSIHNTIFKIFWFVLNCLQTFSVSNFISFFFLWMTLIKLYSSSEKILKIEYKAPYI